MTYESKVKDPDAVLDYKFDWADPHAGPWLADDEEITNYTVTVDDGLTKGNDSLNPEGNAVTVWLSGGTVGQRYEVRCRITTNQGRTEDHTITILCRQK